jgi:opacity protein-like surface antigen
MKRFLLLLGLLIAGFANEANAAVIYLKDGSQVRGTIVSATARDLQVHTPDGTLNITTERILRVEYAETAASAPAQAEPTPTTLPPARSERLARPLELQTLANTRQFFSLGIGVAAPLSRVDFSSTDGGSDNNGNPGLLLSGQYLYGLTSRLSTGVNLEYFNRSGTNSQSLLPESNTDVFGNTVLMLAALKYSLIDHGGVRPYIMGGVGTNYTSTVVEATPNIGFGWSDTDTAETRTLVDENHWGFASTARLGVDFSMMDPSVFSIEAGWTRLSNGTYSATRAGKDVGLTSLSGNQNVLTFAARWGWRF